MNYFLSCDWGTSSFRIRLADAEDGKVLSEQTSAHGIADTFKLWLETGNTDGEKKVSFYLNIIQHHIKKIEERTGHSLNRVKLIVSGMASSSIGFIDIPYNHLPFSVDGSDIQTAGIAATKEFEHEVLVISGLKTNDDVMRGEETQLIGCIAPSTVVKNELYIFPGTHSKHIRVKDNNVVDFKTYMTGEFFELLSHKSILKSAVEPGSNLKNNFEPNSFKRGIKDAMSENLLNSVFKVRVNQLFKKFSNLENYNYLSGLLIGTELEDLKTTGVDAINLVCSPDLGIYYQTALKEIGVINSVQFPAAWVDEAVVRGHHKIGKQLKILA